jgi:hypothetical protein
MQVSDMLSRILRHFISTLVFAGLFISGPVLAQSNDHEGTHKAATLFDQGVREFSHGNYAQAARSFFAADELAPSQEAITNAMSAALKADLYVLAARAAERALSRASSDESTRRAARSTLSKVTPKLARLEIACGPGPCSVELDGEPASLGVSYVMPGTHEVVGQNTQGQRATAQVGCTAGAPCRVVLEAGSLPPTPGPEAPAEQTQVLPPEPVAAPDTAPPAPPQRRGMRERLALGLFAGTGAAALTFAAITTWSGLDALKQHDRAESSPEGDPNERWRPQARRTDRLLAVALVFAGASIGTGIWWARIRVGKRATLSLLPARGLVLSAEARF